MKDYGNVMNGTLLKIFGDEMTYNELKLYARDDDDYNYLEVHTTVITDMNNTKNHITTVFINKEQVLTTEYKENHSCVMYYYLSELEENLTDSEDEEEEEEEEEEEKQQHTMDSIEFKNNIINQMQQNDNYLNSYNYEDAYTKLEAEADVKAIESKQKRIEKINALEKQILNDNYIKRLNCWGIVFPLLFNSISNERSTGKGIRIRKYVINWLQYSIETPCDWLEDEKLQVGRFGTGIWRNKYLKAFNKTEQDVIINVIAKEWGAYDLYK